jgi:pantetheine-phosphate adenylyltransferase
MSHVAVYPGSFDPITFGHLDIIQRSLEFVDELIIAIGTNLSKEILFSQQERKTMVEETLSTLTTKNLKKIRIETFEGLLAHFAEKKGAQTLIRGLRAVSDFEYEFQMAAMNRTLSPGLETLFLMASDHTQFIASRYVKEVARMGGDISKFVTHNVQRQVETKVQGSTVA